MMITLTISTSVVGFNVGRQTGTVWIDDVTFTGL